MAPDGSYWTGSGPAVFGQAFRKIKISRVIAGCETLALFDYAPDALGRGNSLLLVHGLGVTDDLWATIFLALVQVNEVIARHLRRRGQSRENSDS